MLGLAQALDLISTAAAIDQGHTETNPMTAAVLAFGGFVLLVVGKGVSFSLPWPSVYWSSTPVPTGAWSA